MKLTIIHPCIGRRAGDTDYIRTWQMEPLPAATLAGLTPRDVETRLYDDRMEKIPFDEPADLAAISVETYTARRSYQIASEYRKRGVPVVMGGFHASLMPDEVAKYAEAVVVGEAEILWAEARHRRCPSWPVGKVLSSGGQAGAGGNESGSNNIQREALSADRSCRSGSRLSFQMRVLCRANGLQRQPDPPSS